MKILVVTDAWHPQVNGVVRTWDNVIRILEKKHELRLLEPSQFNTIPCPTYPEIRLAVLPRPIIKKTIKEFKPEAIHICTEGPLGISTMMYCQWYKIPFTTSFHSKFPEYIQQRYLIPEDFSYSLLKNFHQNAVRTLVPTPSLKQELEEKKFQNLELWTRGVDQTIFHPKQKRMRKLRFKKKKSLLYVGRLAPEKNVEAFCELSEAKEYKCFVIGDGPQKKELQKKWKKVKFVGYKRGKKLAQYYANADTCVFPSKTDTFGITIIESIACGTPVAAYPVTGPKDIIKPGKSGAMSKNLHKAVTEALALKGKNLLPYVDQYTWEKCAEILVKNLEPVGENQIK